MDTKTCAKCGQVKPVESFQKYKRSRDGLQSYCRDCMRESGSKWRAENLEKSRALGRESKAKQREKDGEETTRQKWNAWYAKNKEQRSAYERERHDATKARAHNLLNAAVRAGTITRPTHCEKCGKERKVDGHHTDYSKPLVVIWLCRSCHRKEQG